MTSRKISLTALFMSVALLASVETAEAKKPSPPPPPPPADPVLVYLNGSGAIEVANNDGKANVVVRSGVPAHRPTWGPTVGHPNAGSSESDPWYIYYENDYCNEVRRFPLWKSGTGLQAGADQVVIKTLPMGSSCPDSLDPSPIAQNLVFGNSYVDAGLLSSLETLDVSTSIPAVSDPPLLTANPGYYVKWATYSGDGLQIAYVIERGTDYATSLWIATYAADAIPHWSHRLLKDYGIIGPAFMEWSPAAGSTQLAFHDSAGIKIINTINGTMQNLGLGRYATWSPDGTKLYFTGANGLAYVTLQNMTVTTLGTTGTRDLKYRNSPPPQ